MQLDRQAALKELGISNDVYDELLQIFIEQTESALQTLNQSITLKDFGQIARAAHLIKGSAANLRIEEIRNLAENIDVQARETKDIQAIENKAAELKTTFGELKNIVSKK